MEFLRFPRMLWNSVLASDKWTNTAYFLVGFRQP